MKHTNSDIDFMRMAIRLARKAFGMTSPNPNVGAIIVKGGRVIGSGYHHKCGMPHAEIEALRSLPDTSDAKGATIYVTLEPCCSFGKTPPCCDALIKVGISRCVIGCLDPNPKHAGKGVDILRKAGIEVTVGVLEDACKVLNTAFFHWITTGRPYVLLKMAQTLDGKIATESGDSKWVTGDEISRARVSRLRRWSDAILVGAETYRKDAPRLTARDAKGNAVKTPRRFVATGHPENLNTRGDALPVETVSLPDSKAWDSFLKRIGSEGVTSLLLEGGGELAASAIRAGAVDELELHVAPKVLGGRDSRTSVAGENPLRMADALPVYGTQTHKMGNSLRINAFFRNL